MGITDREENQSVPSLVDAIVVHDAIVHTVRALFVVPTSPILAGQTGSNLICGLYLRLWTGQWHTEQQLRIPARVDGSRVIIEVI